MRSSAKLILSMPLVARSRSSLPNLWGSSWLRRWEVNASSDTWYWLPSSVLARFTFDLMNDSIMQGEGIGSLISRV